MSEAEEKILEIMEKVPNIDKSENFIKYHAELIWRSKGGNYNDYLEQFKQHI